MTAISDLDRISRQFMSLERPQKPKMLVVDDEPDNLDLLYRTFRRDFQVLRAESGQSALEVLANEGEVAVIISDQRMPEMKGTEFLSKTVPQFPNTMRIILTGFTDVEDLVEAINSGQVYKYITKPWDPDELKGVVQRAAETYELLKQRTEELYRSQAQTHFLTRLITLTCEATSAATLLEPIAALFGETFAANCILHRVEQDQLTDRYAGYSAEGFLKNWLAQDPLTRKTIDSRTMQVATQELWAGSPAYVEAGVQAHLLTPVIYRDRLLALLSLQWQHPNMLREDDLLLLDRATQQVGLALSLEA